MTSHLLALTIDARDPERQARFWAELLERGVVTDPPGLLLPGSSTQVGLRFAPSEAERVGRDRVHLHLTSQSPADQEETVARVLDLGGSHLDVGQLPTEAHVVLADPEGNELCVIEPGNGFLAGCGRLGELACDGTREVGLFWAATLDWGLVLDRDEETAVQSPDGGTKVAWGGPPVAPKPGRNRQRLELVADGDLRDEVERLVTLGAHRLTDERDGAVELADPDSNELVLRRGARA